MRVVVDTGMLVQALIRPSGSLEPALRRLRDNDFTLLFSNAWLGGLLDILAAPSLRQKYHFEDSDVQALIALLLLRGEPVFPLHPIAVCTAPYENHLLEIAVTGHASALVTTGSQLLRTPQIRAYRVRHLFQDIPLITPAAFLRLLG